MHDEKSAVKVCGSDLKKLCCVVVTEKKTAARVIYSGRLQAQYPDMCLRT